MPRVIVFQDTCSCNYHAFAFCFHLTLLFNTTFCLQMTCRYVVDMDVFLFFSWRWCPIACRCCVLALLTFKNVEASHAFMANVWGNNLYCIKYVILNIYLITYFSALIRNWLSCASYICLSIVVQNSGWSNADVLRCKWWCRTYISTYRRRRNYFVCAVWFVHFLMLGCIEVDTVDLACISNHLCVFLYFSMNVAYLW